MSKKLDIDDMKAGVQRIISDYRKKLPILDAEVLGAQMYGAPQLSAFSILRPDERRITDTLADILNPKGRHGQGSLFLNEFLQALGISPIARDEKVAIHVDYMTGQKGLIDIVIDHNDFLIGIEVKIFAKQGKDQLQKYYDALSPDARERPFKLVFLADQKPETAQDVVIRMPWVAAKAENAKGHWARPMATIVADALPGVRAARCRAFIGDFLIWIHETFGDASVSDTEFGAYVDAVKDAFRKEENRPFFGAFMQAKSALHEMVIDEIELALREAVTQAHPEFSFAEDSLFKILSEKDKPWRGSKKNWLKNIDVAIEATSPLRQVFSGIRALYKDGREAKQYKEAVFEQRYLIDEYLKSKGIWEKKSDWWPTYKDLAGSYGNWNENFAARILMESPQGRIAEHKEIKELAERLISLIEYVDAALEGHLPQ